MPDTSLITDFILFLSNCRNRNALLVGVPLVGKTENSKKNT